MEQKIRLSCILTFPDDMHAEDAISAARAAAESINARNVIISQASSRSPFGAVLQDVGQVLVDAGFRDMGYAQTLPGSDEDIQRFLRDKKELVEIISTDRPDKDLIEALTDGDEE